MNCPNCGREARGTFCTGCGTRLSGGATAPGVEPAREAPPQKDPDATSVINHEELRSFLTQAGAQDAAGSPSTSVPESAAPAAEPQWQPTTAPQDQWQPAITPEEQWQPAPAPQNQWQQDQTVHFSSQQVHEPPPAFAPPVSSSYAAPALTQTYAPSGDYPVQVSFDVSPASSKLFAIPIVGFLIRYVLLIPHIAALAVIGLGLYLAQLVLWAPTLFTGKYPDWGYSFVGGALRWAANLTAYFYGLTDQYPPFGLADRGGAYPVHVNFEIPATRNRFFAVPVLGILAREIMLIPHLIIVYALGIVAMVIGLIAWVPVLTTGRYPEWGYSFVGGYIRWAIRVYAYLLGLTDRYPPFEMGN
jgi:Domain of unknown function (DUF4389)